MYAPLRNPAALAEAAHNAIDKVIVVAGDVGEEKLPVGARANHGGTEKRLGIAIYVREADVDSAVSLGALTWRQAEIFRDDETLWTETLKQNGDAWAAHSNLGSVYSNRGDSRAALGHLIEAVRLKPDDENSHFLLGTTLIETGDLTAAATELAEALRLNPNDPRAHCNLAQLLNIQHQPVEAAKHAQAAIRIEPKMPEAHFNLGNAYALQGRPREAANEFREALRLKPNYPDALTNLRIVTGGGPESSSDERAKR